MKERIEEWLVKFRGAPLSAPDKKWGKHISLFVALSVLVICAVFGNFSAFDNLAIWIFLLCISISSVLTIEMGDEERFSFEDIFSVGFILFYPTDIALAAIFITYFITSPFLGRWGWSSLGYVGYLQIVDVGVVHILRDLMGISPLYLIIPIVMVITTVHNTLTLPIWAKLTSTHPVVDGAILLSSFTAFRLGVFIPLAILFYLVLQTHALLAPLLILLPLFALAAIGKRINTNMALRQETAQAKAKAQARSETLSITAHELRTPLTTIHGYAQGLLDHRELMDEKQTNKSLESITTQATRLNNLITDLLTQSKLDSGKLAPNTELCDVSLAVKRAIAASDVQADNLVQEGMHVCCDPDHLERILINYLSNAAKYGKKPFIIRGKEEGKKIRLEVEDHGTGVPKDFEKDLFESFKRDHRTRNSVTGTGLGLAITKGLAEQNNGEVYYKAAPHGGSVFGILLPSDL